LDGGARLDSWKAIAAYLERDERTVQRWERELGLPIRRVPGGRGRSVFAYASEIDAWLKTTGQTGLDAPPVAPTAADPPTPPIPNPRAAWTPAWRYAIVAATLIVAALAWRLRPATASVNDLRLEATPDGVTALDAAGATRWLYPFPPEYRVAPAEDMPDPTRIANGTHPAIYVGTAYRDRRADDGKESGAIIELDAAGTPRRSFSFADEVTFDGTTYGPPWIVTCFAVNGVHGARRIAVAAHHAVWDASLVTVLDKQMQRHGTFVHAGWIEQLDWLAPNRLLIGGFSNAHDGGMIALLDPTALGGIDGQGPEPADSRYHCSNCAAGAPLRMAVMPRTELNRITASRFNRARVQVLPGRIRARTIEVPAAGLDAVDALYEFSPALDLLRASFGNHYWEFHRVLETQGRLHPREESPEKDGPREILTWEPATGWRPLKIR